MVLPILFWLMNSVCPTLHFDLDFKATIETQDINKAKLPYKSLNDSARMAVYLNQVRVKKVGMVAFQKTKCVCRFYIKLKL